MGKNNGAWTNCEERNRKRTGGPGGRKPAEQFSKGFLPSRIFSGAEGAVPFPQPGSQRCVQTGIIFRIILGDAPLAKEGLPRTNVVSHQKMTLRKVMKSPGEVFKKEMRFQTLCLVEAGPALPNRVQVQSPSAAGGGRDLQ